jgi:enoyl-[acyl-carrier-protein] reductase (NADH)
VFGGSKETADAMLVHAQPLPLAGQAEDIAQAALFLASDASRFITGHTLVVDGGATAGSIARAPRRGEERTRPQRAFAGPSFET